MAFVPTQAAASAAAAGRWYVDSDMGMIPVDDSFNASVEAALHRGDQTITISAGRNTPCTYTVDLTGSYQQNTAKQRNNSTGRERHLRRYLVSDHEWQFQETATTFLGFHKTEILEHEYRSDPTSQLTIVSPSGYTLFVDFRQMVQTNLETGKVRPIRRIQTRGGGGGAAGSAATAAITSSAAGFGAANGGVGASNVAAADGDATIWRTVDGQVATQDQCVICLHDLKPDSEDVVELQGCQNHMYHKECLGPMIQKSNSGLSLKCPICKKVSGTPQMGDQPKDGKMRVSTTKRGGVQGMKGEVIVITYDFPDGIQGQTHPSPGSKYYGTKRTAYLPNTTEGQEVSRLLQIAFDRHLIFTVGTSITSGQSNCVVWAGIHHKTSKSGGAYGYPDETYIARVKGELADRGVC